MSRQSSVETPSGRRPVRVERADGRVEDDWVAVEEPLEIRVDGEALAVTMRTPGHDLELAAGFLFAEGIVRDLADLEALTPCTDPTAYDPDNLVEATLAPAAAEARRRARAARRQVIAVAACGMCGRATLDEVYRRLPEVAPLAVERRLLACLPERMRRRQELFAATGGLHAAALFDAGGELLCLREDVGRHNAVDKVVGRYLLRGELPLAGRILVVSSRAGFEIVQKALLASIPVLVAVGAASSLAVELARDGGLELYAFMSEGRGNRHV